MAVAFLWSPTSVPIVDSDITSHCPPSTYCSSHWIFSLIETILCKLSRGFWCPDKQFVKHSDESVLIKHFHHLHTWNNLANCVHNSFRFLPLKSLSLQFTSCGLSMCSEADKHHLHFPFPSFWCSIGRLAGHLHYMLLCDWLFTDLWSNR